MAQLIPAMSDKRPRSPEHQTLHDGRLDRGAQSGTLLWADDGILEKVLAVVRRCEDAEPDNGTTTRKRAKTNGRTEA